jgi:Flp pilus assembly protein TadD
MADRYAYIPHIGLFLVLTWGVADVLPWRERLTRPLTVLALATVLTTLGVLTARQTRVWRDDRIFWGYTARMNPDSFIAHQALAGILQGAGQTREALAMFHRAARIRPELARVHVQYARLLARSGRSGAAAAEYRKAVALEPDVAETRYALAQVLTTRGKRRAARRQLERALALRPDYPDAQKALATLPSG